MYSAMHAGAALLSVYDSFIEQHGTGWQSLTALSPSLATCSCVSLGNVGVQELSSFSGCARRSTEYANGNEAGSSHSTS